MDFISYCHIPLADRAAGVDLTLTPAANRFNKIIAPSPPLGTMAKFKPVGFLCGNPITKPFLCFEPILKRVPWLFTSLLVQLVGELLDLFTTLDIR
jgi:hypothetical protein